MLDAPDSIHQNGTLQMMSSWCCSALSLHRSRSATRTRWTAKLAPPGLRYISDAPRGGSDPIGWAASERIPPRSSPTIYPCLRGQSTGGVDRTKPQERCHQARIVRLISDGGFGNRPRVLRPIRIPIEVGLLGGLPHGVPWPNHAWWISRGLRSAPA